ncbi:MAG: hypothetical protein ABJI96_14300 [Paracoccaceae bacterium]
MKERLAGLAFEKLAIGQFHSFDTIDIKVGAGGHQATCAFFEKEFGLTASEMDSTTFSRKRVLYTLSKNNDPAWIKDWMHFHHVNHGSDAVLLCDNGSEQYDCEGLLDELRSVNGYNAIKVVLADFPYMPALDSCRNPHACLFVQSAMINLAATRGLRPARSVLACDIDELVLPHGGKSVFRQTEASILGTVAFNGRWTYPEDNQIVAHASHYMVQPDSPVSRSKYCFRPDSYMGRGELDVHTIHGGLRNQILRQLSKISAFSYIHCHDISTAWKWSRNSKSFDNLTKEQSIKQTLESAFPRPK